jgi:hypothetical protein
MNIGNCLLLALEAFGGVLGLAAALMGLFYVFRPLFRLYDRYVRWCVNLENDALGAFMGMALPIGVVMALVGFVVCLLGGLK